MVCIGRFDGFVASRDFSLVGVITTLGSAIRVL